MLVRLQKAIALSGLCSRRHAEQLILEGRVSLNNKRVTELWRRVDISKERISVDGRILNFQKERLHLAFYKPRQCISSLGKVTNIRNISEFLPDELKNLKIAGRLDYNYTGLIILTNDGELSYRVNHPRFGISRTYQVKFPAQISGLQMKKLTDEVLSAKKIQGSWAEITVPCGYEKRLNLFFLKTGTLPDKVRRVAIGNIWLKNLRPGEFRMLSRSEIKELYALCNRGSKF